LLARTTSSGVLSLYRGNGTFADTVATTTIGGGWQAMSAIVRIGDLNRDGHEDVIARQSSNGDLWFYPGTGTGLGTRKRIGTVWNGMREITGVGDFDRDGHNDLAAVHKPTGLLLLYRGSGTALRAGVQIATGFGGRAPVA
jgi:hypothetical protein